MIASKCFEQGKLTWRSSRHYKNNTDHPIQRMLVPLNPHKNSTQNRKRKVSDWSHFLLLALSLPPFVPLQIKPLTILCGISISFNSLSLFFFSLNNKIRKHSAFSIGVQFPSVYQATATVPVRTVLLGVELFDSDFLAEEEDDFFQLLSLASSISICSCLHSLLQNGVFPLQKSINISYFSNQTELIKTNKQFL